MSVAIFWPANQAEWRSWLEENHQTKCSVWLVFYNKSSKKDSITWSEAVDVALCFGWIDSKKIKIDQDTTHQFFSKRKPKSTWSRINKIKIQQLTDDGLMTPKGLDAIDIAKQNGSWTILDDTEALIIPDDLGVALKKEKGANEYFQSLSQSVRKMMLQSLVLARRPETRQKRIDQIVDSILAGDKGIKKNKQ
ncbi:YdeI/OmpD-associated family protein [Chitinophaga varians]|uniref:YdeI/OmpD-associated family protein n=1 Tax=Chitinophaga varians TaxID=2202339 RepID=UPI00165F82F7|nr:YdeI/OmpD-associated family protein [Chitinophaga varians]MBC9915617.1 YdeI/OmpD-associated family protein [Chitinophaga varians]